MKKKGREGKVEKYKGGEERGKVRDSEEEKREVGYMYMYVTNSENIEGLLSLKKCILISVWAGWCLSSV